MANETAGQPRRPAGLRWIAVVVAAVFGCTTVRAPASVIGETVPVKDGHAEPQLELWIESARQISPAESAKAAAEARAALESALAARQAPDGDAMLVVRAQGVARTGSRRSSQGAAVAGLVVGAVVIVVVAVVMLVTGKGSGKKGGGKGGPGKAPAGGGRAASAGRGAASTAGTAGAAAAARPSPGRLPAQAAARPSPGPRPAPVSRPAPVPRPAPAPWLGPVPVAPAETGPYVWFDFWYVYPGPVYVEPPPAVGVWEPLPPPAWDTGAPPPGPFAGEGAPAAGEPAAHVTSITLPPPPELRVGDRGFFAGDETVLELVWVDRHTGVPLRSKTVRGEVDPRDARAVGKLLDGALADESGWRPVDGLAPPDGPEPAAE